jgi:superfamily II DNA/RNA helicase
LHFTNFPYFPFFIQLDKLIAFIEDNDVIAKREKMLVFAETKRTVDFLERMLARAHIKATGIHGDKTQQGRDAAMNQFRWVQTY